MSFIKLLCSSQMFGNIVDQKSLIMEIEKLDVSSDIIYAGSGIADFLANAA